MHRTGERVTVEGSVESERSAEFLLDLYANRAPQKNSSGRTYDSSDRGEGEIYLTTVTVGTNEAGLAHFSLTATGVRAGDELSATLTKTRGGDELTQPTPSTGEFSPCSRVS